MSKNLLLFSALTASMAAATIGCKKEETGLPSKERKDTVGVVMRDTLPSQDSAVLYNDTLTLDIRTLSLYANSPPPQNIFVEELPENTGVQKNYFRGKTADTGIYTIQVIAAGAPDQRFTDNDTRSLFWQNFPNAVKLPVAVYVSKPDGITEEVTDPMTGVKTTSRYDVLKLMAREKVDIITPAPNPLLKGNPARFKADLTQEVQLHDKAKGAVYSFQP